MRSIDLVSRAFRRNPRKDLSGSSKVEAILNRLFMFLLTGSLALLAACAHSPVLERIQSGGYLLVATKISPSTHFLGENGPEGFEYELASRFAESLNLKAQFVPFRSDQAIVQAVRSGQVHMAAANLHPESKIRGLSYSVPYQSVNLLVLYNKKNQKPKELSDLNGSLLIPKDSGYSQLLPELHSASQAIDSNLLENISAPDAFTAIDQGEVDYTLAHSLEFVGNSLLYPNLDKAFALKKEWHLAWAFPSYYDVSLKEAADRFLRKQIAKGYVAELASKYQETTKQPKNLVDTIAFWRNAEDRLPRFEDSFKQASQATGLDWRLLAAVGYQESHWQPDAVSPRGVKGLMMLTKTVAKATGVDNRFDPDQSIKGGAQYLKDGLAIIPDRIQGDDRVWLAIAAYNVGYGHLEDARILTQKQGGDPDKWEDVRARLPLLKDEKYHSQTKLGYARGDEPVRFVDNIQRYYKLLIHLDNERQRQLSHG